MFSLITDENEGRKDFEKVITTVTIPPTGRVYFQEVFVPIFDDDINEADEGFYMMIEVDEAKSDPKDVAGLSYSFNGLTRIEIIDDDGKCRTINIFCILYNQFIYKTLRQCMLHYTYETCISSIKHIDPLQSSRDMLVFLCK